MAEKDMPIENYVSHWFQTSMFKELYEHLPFPVRGKEDWLGSSERELLAPPPRTKIGRPRKKRYSEHGEDGTNTKASRMGRVMRCKYCFIAGHNDQQLPNCNLRVVFPSTSAQRKILSSTL
ncbi:hypothetical protein ACFE04_012384 [Oxalis oulophora]